MYLNCGSAVVLPEVFLKAVALARNRGIALAESDDGQPRFHPRSYARKPTSWRVRRPAAGRGYSLIGRPRDHDSAWPAALKRANLACSARSRELGELERWR